MVKRMRSISTHKTTQHPSHGLSPRKGFRKHESEVGGLIVRMGMGVVGLDFEIVSKTG